MIQFIRSEIGMVSIGIAISICFALAAILSTSHSSYAHHQGDSAAEHSHAHHLHHTHHSKADGAHDELEGHWWSPLVKMHTCAH